MIETKKRIKIASILFIISLSIIISLFFFLEFGFYKNRVVALVGNQKIYESDIKEKLLDIFPNSNPQTFEVRRLPEKIISKISKEIFIKKKLYKEAVNSMIYKDKSIKDNIDKYSKNLINEYYINSLINKKITEEELNNKYLELLDNAKEQQEYKISHILVKTKYQSDKIIEKLNNNSFKILAQKYSLDRKTNSRSGNLGYINSNDLREEFNIVRKMKKGEISNPIKTKDGWHVIKLTDIKTPKLDNFENIKFKLAQEIREEKIKELFSKITKNIEVNILITTVRN